MKHRLRYVIGLVLAMPLLAVAPIAIAHGESSNSNSTVSSPPSTGSSGSGNNSQQDSAQDKAEMKARLDKLKTDLKIKLSTVEDKLIKQKCQPAQTIVKTLADRTDKGAVTRTKAYEELSSKLNTLLGKLQAKNADTAQLQQELTGLQAKITTYQTDLTAYKQALADTREVDCTTDPSAFKAALETARTARDKVVKDANDIKAYVKDTIKPTLQTIRGQLNTSEGGN